MSISTEFASKPVFNGPMATELAFRSLPGSVDVSLAAAPARPEGLRGKWHQLSLQDVARE